MNRKVLTLNDASGGLHDTVPPSAVALNEFSRLSNWITDEGGWPGKKRLGKDSYLRGPIEMVEFVADGSDRLLLHLDDASAAATFTDSSASTNTFTPAMANSIRVAGILPAAGPLGQKFVAGYTTGWIKRVVDSAQQLDLDAAAACTFDADIYINPDFSGAPIVVPAVYGVNVPAYQTGAPIIATYAAAEYLAAKPLLFSNRLRTGLTLHRDFDAATGLDVGGPYAKFTVYTANGTAVGTVTSARTGGLPTATWLQIRGRYDSVTGTVRIYVDGSLHATTLLAAGALLENSDAWGAAIGGTTWDGPQNRDVYTGGYGTLIPIGQYWNTLAQAAVAVAVEHGGAILTAYLNLANAASLLDVQMTLVADLFIDCSNQLNPPFTELSASLALLQTGFDDIATLKADVVAKYAIAVGLLADAPTTAAYNEATLQQLPAVMPPYYSSVASFLVDEVRVGVVARDTFPYKRPRGKPWPLSKADGTRQLVFAAGDSLYMTIGDGARLQLNAAANDSLGAETFSETAYWDGFQFGDVLYLSNGVDNPKSWDGTTLRPWGEGKKMLTLTATNVGGGSGIGAGDHVYYYTMAYGSKETGPSVLTLINNVTDAFDNNLAAIPVGIAGCTARKIYRKKISDGKLYWIRTIADNTTTTMTGAYTAGGSPGPTTDTGRDGVVEADLGTGAYTEMPAAVLATTVGKPRFLAGLHNRIFMGGMLDAPYEVDWTESGTAEVRPAANAVTAKQDQGVILGLAPYYSELHVSKGGEGTLVLRGDKPANWTVLQTLHPTIGSVDHWAFVHRTVPQRDGYILCFWAKDGAYGYAGQDFFKLSGKIEQTVAGLIQGNSTRIDSIVTTQAQWQAALAASGSATQNISAPSYATDGFREVPGQLRIVNQLDYLSLNMPSGATGKVIAICKGPAEGEFFFGVDTQNVLFRTTNNFATAAAVGATPLAAGERIIEIVRRGTDQFYFCLTDSEGAAGSSGGGKVYAWNQSGAAWSTIYNTALYYDLDVPFFMNGNQTGVRDGRGIGHTSLMYPPGSGYNIYVNHAQTLRCTLTQTVPASSPGSTSRNTISSGSTVTGEANNTVYTTTFTGAGTRNYNQAVGIGFYAFMGYNEQFLTAQPPNITLVTAQYTRREFPRWRGGTHGPQAWWDASNGGGRLVFLASTAEDGNGNRSSYLRTLTSAGTLVNQYTAQNVSAWATNGLKVYFHTIPAPTAAGFQGVLRRSTLGTPGTVEASAAAVDYLLLSRLNYNSSSGFGLAAAKYFGAVAGQEFWTYKASLRSYLLATGLTQEALLKELTAVGDSGALFTELGLQSNTPFGWYAAVSRMSTADPNALFYITPGPLAAGNVTAYKTAYGDATGISSNLLFVPASGSSASNTWADRLYFSPSGATNQVLQLGVPGTWRVLGVYASSAFVTSGISAFGDFQVSYAGAAGFELRNGPDATLSSAVYVPVTPNAQLVAFAPSASNNAFQWRITLTWDNTVGAASPGISPYVDVVDVAYYQGSPNIPRVAAYHYKSRTYWALAEVGQTYNNLVLVLQKNDSWTRYDNWRPDGMNLFRGNFVAIEDYTLVKIESGRLDLGILISTRARTGYILNDMADKCLRDVHANVASFVNQDQPTMGGWMKVQPYGGDQALDAEWFFPLPAAATPEPRQVRGQFRDGFPFAYARAFALEVSTSDDDTDFIAPPKQVEEIAGMMITLLVSNQRTLEGVT